MSENNKVGAGAGPELQALAAIPGTSPKAVRSARAGLGRHGRAAEPSVRVDRELAAGDLARWAGAVGPLAGAGSEAPTIKTLRASHHRLAMILAKGATDVEASLATGYSPSRICLLKQAPAFKGLLEHYGVQVEGAFADMLERMHALALDTMEEIQRRLDEDPESIKTEEVLKTLTAMLDRTGNGPTTKVEQTTGLSADTLAMLKDQAGVGSRGVVIDAQDYRATPTASPSPSPTPTLISPRPDQEGKCDDTPCNKSIAQCEAVAPLPAGGLGESEEEVQGGAEKGAHI